MATFWSPSEMQYAQRMSMRDWDYDHFDHTPPDADCPVCDRRTIWTSRGQNCYACITDRNEAEALLRRKAERARYRKERFIQFWRRLFRG